ncbi:MAG TPA: LysM peptidoglycan-binding domain-containing protein, partial [Rectinemataceae bacterium]|nr:LysM peptidoglycan-binding domain-containing protein [Rectinemataceae bacterium]
PTPSPAVQPADLFEAPSEATSGINTIAPDTASAAEPRLASPEIIMSAGILVDGLQYNLDMPWGHEQFEEYRATYMTSGGKKWLMAVMGKSLPYLGYVEEKLEELDLPRELLYLPVIESEYSPFAVSRSGATGIWQFMRNSISGYGLSISEWTDDRKDFMKSTDAALRKLKDNYRILGDWPLAIAAYNAGLGAVSRAIKSSNGESIDFWQLYESKKLSREPLSYVPKFLAVASILCYPELHGFPADWGEKHLWEALETSRQVDMNVLAERTGISIDILKKGNAELNYHITPPSATHMVKVPAAKAEEVRAVLKDVSAPLFKYEIYKVKSGDTMSAIAQRYSTPLTIIMQANPGLKADRIKIGQTIVIPHLSGTISAKKKADGSENAAFSDYYTIKKGDTLWDISLLFDVRLDKLAEQNGIGVNSTLRIGQKLKVPAL